MMQKITEKGFVIYPELLSPQEQTAVVDDLRAVLKSAPLMRHVTPGGQKMSVRMSAAGQFGWISDATGYRYSKVHPNGQPWPEIPHSVLKVWRQVSDSSRLPECCLINWYDADARMGLHRDASERDYDQPVVSLSLGDEGLFRMGNADRGGKTASIWLRSGDVVVMGGPARLAYHGVDKIRPGSSTLLNRPGRVNLTLRVVTAP